MEVGAKKKAERDGSEKLPPPGERGVIYLGRIPHGFYEDEMRSYFSQFGSVTRLKLYRSKKVTAIFPLVTSRIMLSLSLLRLAAPEGMLSSSLSFLKSQPLQLRA